MSKKLNLKICKNVAQNKNGKCLSKEYKGINVKMLWKCELGHEFNMTMGNVSQGQWCPRCRKLKSKTQELIYNIIQDIFPKHNIEYNYRGFDWLKTDEGGKQELDIYVHDIKLAIEYDGEQHFKPMRFGSKKNMNKKLHSIQKLDRIKNEKIKNNPMDIKFFLRFNFKEKITKKYILSKLSKIGCCI